MMQQTSAAAFGSSATERETGLRAEGEELNKADPPKQEPIIQVEGLRKTYQTARGRS